MKNITKLYYGLKSMKWITCNRIFFIAVILFVFGGNKLEANCFIESNAVSNWTHLKYTTPLALIPPDTTMVSDATILTSTIKDSILLSPGHIFDTIFDNFGNTYSLNSLMINTEETSFRTSCNAGYFNVIFEPNCGMDPTGTQLEADRAAVVCQVLSDISDFIVSPLSSSGEKVNIWVRDLSQIVTNPSTSGVLGLASSFYVLPAGSPAIGGIADNQIWRTINTGEDAYTGVVSPLVSSNSNPGSPANYFHGMMAFNFSNSFINWHIDMNSTNPSGNFDLYSVVLHEITHALGFASLINDDGISKFGTNFNYYSRYDLFLENQSNVKLIDGTFSGCSLYDFEFNSTLTPANVITPPNAAPNTCVTDQTVCGNAVIYSGGTTVSVYTPNCFESASTLSHFEDMCFPAGTPYGNDVYFNMSNAQNTGANKRFLQIEEATVLCDLGYSLNTTYGNNMVVTGSFKNYGTSCTGLEVGGVNDGITAGGAYAFIGPISTAITLTGILNNDYNADAFECLQVILGTGTLNVTGGTGATTVTYTDATPGLKLLRYIPYNSTSGKRGNITYVLVYVLNDNCTPSACSMLNNGDFESSNTCGQWGSYPYGNVITDCWESFYNTPDVFQRNCTNTNNGWNNNLTIPTPWSNPPSDSWNGTPNNNFIGLFSGTTHWNESIQSLMSTPIVQNESYLISFRAKVSNNSGWGGPPSGIDGKLTIGGGTDFFAQVSGPTTVLPPQVVHIEDFVVPNDNTWHHFSYNYTYTGTINLNNFVLFNSSNMTSTPGTDVIYIYIDDVSILPQSEVVLLNFPYPLCINQEITDLSTYLTPPTQGGEFTGDGVSESGGIYSFDATTAGEGNHLITYTYESSLGCTLSVYAFIDVIDDNLEVDIDASVMIMCEQDSVILTATGADTYSWTPGDITDNPIIVYPTGNTVYTVTGVGANGCVDHAKVDIEVMSCICSGINITDFTWTNTFSLTPNTLYALNADVTVTGNNVILTDAVINIATNLTITIENGAVLTIDKSHLYACDNMWNGIVIEPGGQLIVTNNSFIEDALFAIDIQNHTATTPVLIINESVFNRNYINVYITDYQEQVTTYPFEIHNNVFTSRSIPFTTTSWPSVTDLTTLINSGELDEHYEVGNYNPAYLKNPLSSYTSGAGIYLDNVGTINGMAFFDIEIDGDDGVGTFNLFDELMFGIYAVNSNFTSTNNVFQFMNKLFNPTLGKGIYAENTNIGSAAYQVTIDGLNVFYDCPVGVEILNYTHIDILQTDMRSTQMPISSIPEEGELGIFVQTPYLLEMNIDENTITNIRNGIVFLADVDPSIPNNQGQLIGPVSIKENIIQATLDGKDGNPTDEYVLNGIIADNTVFTGGFPSADSGPIVIKENKLYQVHNGIHAQFWLFFMYTVDIGWKNRLWNQENYISLRKIEYPSSTNQDQYGILHVYNFSGRIENNTVEGFSNTSDLWHGIIPVDMINPGMVIPRITCNSVINTGKGINFYSSGGYVFNDNTMDNNQFGFVLDNTTIGVQGDDNYASGNKWINFTSGNFETFTMNGTDPNNSVLWIDNSDADQVPTLNGSTNSPTDDYAISNGLSIVSTNDNTTVCNAPTGLVINDDYYAMQQKSGKEFTSLLEKLVFDSLKYGRFEKEQYIQAQHRAYRMMELQQEWTVDASNELHTFYKDAQKGNIGSLAKVGQLLGSGNFMDAKSLVGSITPENNIEKNYVSYYTVYINAKTETFTVADSLELNKLIHGCVSRDGETVHHARVLHRLLYRDFKTYFDDCPNNREFKKQQVKQQEISSGLILYPNPSTGEVWFDLKENTDDLRGIAIYSLEGMLLYTELPQGNKINFGFSSGAYIVVVTTKSASYRERVVIIN